MIQRDIFEAHMKKGPSKSEKDFLFKIFNKCIKNNNLTNYEISYTKKILEKI